MIGSPDLLAFTGIEGFGEAEEDHETQSLPEEFSVPLVPPSQPWTTSAQFHRDFILVAEFCEQVGPKPVLTIPDDPRVIGSFDLNHFSVRLMSVDYQASGPTPVRSSSPSPRLNFSEDSKVILGDSADDAFAYVHHMTLYDLEARGMVRPFCMAYVCSDQTKLMENFCELSACFSQASDSLKTGNRQAFSMELQRKLQELEYKRLILLQDTKHPTVENGHFCVVGERANELEAVEHLISNHRDLLRQVTSYPNRKLKQPDFLPYDMAYSLADPLLLPEPCLSFSSAPSTSWRSEHHLKPLHELCNAYFLSLMKEQLSNTERRLRGDRSLLQTARITHDLSRRASIVNFLFELCPDYGEEEESVEFELQRGAKGGVELLHSEPMSMESFSSCVEEIPIKLEAGEGGTPEHSIAMEMAGSVSSSDSIEVLGTEKSYRTQHVLDGPHGREAAVMTDTSSRRATADGVLRRVRALARRANSEDSIEVLSTTESIFPDDLTAITEEEAELHPQTDELKDEAPPEGDGFRKEESPNATSGTEDENRRPVDTHESVTQTPVNVEEEEVIARSKQVRGNHAATTCSLLRGEVSGSWPQLVPDLHANFTAAATLDEADRWSPPSVPLRLPSIDEASDRTSFTSSSDPPSPTRNSHGSSSHSDRKRRRRRAGARALRFLRQNSFSQHAVFCLLSGRPLVIIGGDESLVRKLVEALSLFLPAPGPTGNAVMMCLTSPLQLTDLLTWKLIGIHRSQSSSSAGVLHSLTRYSRYLALLDLDQRTLHCPSYSGSLVDRLASPHSSIRRGVTYLLHLESCLTALTLQALLYTFSPALRRRNEEDSSQGEDFLLSRGFCSSQNDLSVMRFLSDLINQRHAGRGPPFLRFSYCSMHLHKNTNAT